MWASDWRAKGSCGMRKAAEMGMAQAAASLGRRVTGGGSSRQDSWLRQGFVVDVTSVGVMPGLGVVGSV
ncbi:hypothetical protein E2562_025289 [Oryza meyeriana var. granulata]|uniref:Uncharacterized protein n=1 Tax=Oryza meyeriana var. granulata TaxID=110450 RepID=A0A6G1BQ52_9ORYZ|nr:hypothetical protein E2562_025289 [Oryza meyeriana var. granulata]